MGKFLRLIKNEYIKIFKKVSTWVILALLAVCAVGYPFMAKFIEWQMSQYGNSRSNYTILDDYKDDIERLKDVKTEGWEQEVERLQYFIDNKLTDGWKWEAASNMFEIKNDDGTAYSLDESQKSKVVSDYENEIKNSDWKGYLQTTRDLLDYDLSIANDTEKASWQELYKYLIDNEIEPNEDNWQYNVANQLCGTKINLAEMDASKAAGEGIDTNEYSKHMNNKHLYEYRLANNVEYDISEHENLDGTNDFDFWAVFTSTGSLVSLIGLITIIIAGGIVSSEFSQGTIKFLLINPVKRWKILMSKYATSISLGYVLIAVLYIISCLMSMIIFGASNLDASYLSVVDGAVKELPGFIYVLKIYLLSSTSMVVMATLGFAISSLLRSSALAIGVSVMAMFGGNTILLIMQQLGLDWGRYLIFANTNLASIMSGNSLFTGQTVTSALCVIGIHMVIFLLTAWDGFTRREV